MSYHISVKVTGGNPEVTLSGTVPEGIWSVHGHDDERSRALSLEQRSADGRYVASASSTHYKEES